MPDSFRQLTAAILEDDRAKVKELLELDSELARSCVAAKDQLEARIGHWIYSGDTALHIAAAGRHVEIAGMLLDAGANVSSATNRRRSQPLHYAADGSPDSPLWNADRQVQTIQLLLNAGACIDAPDKNGATPLHRAVRTRCAAAVKILLNAGADPTMRNKPGSTPFHLAVRNTGRGGSGSGKARIAQREIVEAFLEHGVSPQLTDANGKTVAAWAASDCIQKILASNGG